MGQKSSWHGLPRPRIIILNIFFLNMYIRATRFRIFDNGIMACRSHFKVTQTLNFAVATCALVATLDGS